MGVYLNIYIKIKALEEPTCLVAYRDSGILFGIFDPVKEPQEITEEMINECIESVKSSINKGLITVSEYSKYAHGNLEIINEIIDTEGYIRDQTEVLHKLQFIKELVLEAGNEWADYDKVLYNIE